MGIAEKISRYPQKIGALRISELLLSLASYNAPKVVTPLFDLPGTKPRLSEASILAAFQETLGFLPGTDWCCDLGTNPERPPAIP